MKNLFILAALSLFALTAKASEVYVYGSLQAEREYKDSGSSDSNDEISFTNDLDSQPFGVGAEYRFSKGQDFFLALGALYQAPVKAKNDVETIALGHFYFNAYSKVTQGLNLFIGTQYSMINIDSKDSLSDYEADDGVGFRLGVDFELPHNLGAQFYYRGLHLDSTDQDGYEGDLNLSSLMANIGYRF